MAKELGKWGKKCGNDILPLFLEQEKCGDGEKNAEVFKINIRLTLLGK